MSKFEVPSGYKLVPLVPTPEMVAQGLEDEGCTVKDAYAATRRAIVRAAAEIGRAMP